MFTTSMKGKWGIRAYLDLFSGPGKASFGSGEAVDTSPLIALSARKSFDRYVFCDLNPRNIESLRTRVEARFQRATVAYVVGDANLEAARILHELHRNPGQTMLVFCMLDPFRLAALKFATVQKLAGRFVDFLVLVPSYMDANRHRAILEGRDNTVLAEFLGNPGWREAWADLESRRGVGAFGRFVANEFIVSMVRLGFQVGARRVVRRRENNMKLYHLLGFSRHERGLQFFRIADRRTDPIRKTGQLSLFDEDEK
jgi:three-Cys-motif partner protein